jgi:imidazolonepropionase
VLESFEENALPDKPLLFRNARLARFHAGATGIGIVDHGALIVSHGHIRFAGAEADLPAGAARDAESIDCKGRWITPAPIDCHTHIVHGGNRAREFEMRLAGASYSEIAATGGGIVSTVAATAALSTEELAQQALPRLDCLIAEGVCTVEVKSGYGLSIKAELAMLRAARLLETLRPVRIVTSCLAAHAVPAAFRGRNKAYLEEVALPLLREAHRLGFADAVDGFCEGIAFSPEEIGILFTEAKRLGLPVKLHADQLSDLGGAELAARFGALSADHVEYTNAEGAASMGRAGTVAVLLPGAFYTLRETRKPPVELFRQHGVRMAVATDCNPGTSPMTSILLCANMAATLFGLTVEEALAGITREAARALGLLAHIGTLEAGKSADLAIWDIESPAELVYRIGFNPLHLRVFGGRPWSISRSIPAM